MEGESSEFQDWEVLNHGSAMVHSDLEEEAEAAMDGDSEGMIRPDYFSIDFHERYAKTVSGVDLSEGSVESDNPSWIDPGSENRYGRKNSGEFWSDSSSDRSDERKLSDSDAKPELGAVGFVEMKSEVGVDGIGEELGAGDASSGMLEPDECKYSCLDAKSELGLVGNDTSAVGLGQSVELGGGNIPNIESGEGDECSSEKESEDGAIVEMKPDTNGVGDKRSVAWWKVPLEFLKYCAFRASPVWSFSVAAALMGFIILARRLSRMKRKTQSLQLKVTVDEKKVSLFKSRAARLNDAFSVVRRVPIVRPTHPAAGLASWPAMSLR